LNRADSSLADELYARVRENVDTDVDEIMWGTPGTLIAAQAMFHATRDERWKEAWDMSANALLARRGDDGLWTQHLYGHEAKSLTPPHGVVGNLQALAPLLDDAARRQLQRETNDVLTRTAVRDDGYANWPPRDRPALPGPDGQVRLQWCAGAPGIVHSAGDYLDDELLLAGAELTWHAGAHGAEKGPSICHGTAGNGYAFLKAFKRTGDEKWLDRARRFAMHALAQTQRRDPRYSLWTGDLGVAIYATDCLAATSEYPIIETLD
jgi:lantibiotic modifying enzyme